MRPYPRRAQALCEVKIEHSTMLHPEGFRTAPTSAIVSRMCIKKP